MRSTACLLALLLTAAACNGSGVVEQSQDTEDVLDRLDTPVAFDEYGSETPGEDLAGPDLPRAEDLSLDTPAANCEAGEGCFLDPCEENADCQSMWCVEHMGTDVCTTTCQDECPAGWTCKALSQTEPDVVYICVSEYAQLCTPCADKADCAGITGTQDACVDYGPEGSFCGGVCDTAEDCPWGFSCVDALTVDGVETTQCVADAGVCPCTDKAAALGLWTPCEVSNEFGVCDGKRVCSDEGLSSCDAPSPLAEVCNGLDDDCDGDIDEPTLLEGSLLELCDDDNDCTEDSCKGEAGCDHLALDAAECVDGNPCTVADHCEAGVCVGMMVDCDDGDPCTDDSCDEAGGCVNEPNAADCDDGDPCTVADECAAGVCAGVAVDCDCQSDGDCAALEDGDLCNGTLVCDKAQLPFKCVVDPATLVSCPAPDPVEVCLESICVPDTGVCALVPAHEGWLCDDGDLCTAGDACQQGTCAAGAEISCDDGNPCTDDACEAGAGCAHQANTLPCDDGNPCTLGDHCGGGTCAAESMMECDDGNLCTTDSCTLDQGCQYVINDLPCDDDDLCTTGDHCHLGACISAGTLNCDDGNLCTDDACAPESGCTFTFNNAPCDDGEICTSGDACSQGWCLSGQALDCDDGEPCTADACVPGQGCTHGALDGPCDDGDACTTGDICLDGECVSSGVKMCDDANLCTDDSCAPESGCVFVANEVPCDDGDACTIADACADSVCLGGEALDCDDENPCTDDSCDGLTGCVSESVANGTPCGEDLVCMAGECLSCGELTGSETFSYTGGAQTFTVPPCIESVTIEVWGAQGGDNPGNIGAGVGGKGGYATGTLTVTPGEVLNVFVGGAGSSVIAGGWNGGGDGGLKGSCGGGGASDVRRNGITVDERVIVGAGGGGAAHESAWSANWSVGNGACSGGDGGGATGLAGGYWQGECQGGTGGTQSAGGAYGGAFGIGGPAMPGDGDTGGGGGGWYGGGGGGECTGFNGCGGGGSSYVDGLVGGSTTAGQRSGDGQVVISW